MLYAIDQVFLEILEDYFANLFIFFCVVLRQTAVVFTLPQADFRPNDFLKRDPLFTAHPFESFFCTVGSMRCDEIIQSDSIM